jgi:hypothetical protein
MPAGSGTSVVLARSRISQEMKPVRGQNPPILPPAKINWADDIRRAVFVDSRFQVIEHPGRPLLQESE